ncbi:MAG: carbohydrate ABC transporter permease, partial [Treponema sp.]|nr:carbohydrate ABC transporter permease [Treponema sp.]
MGKLRIKTGAYKRIRSSNSDTVFYAVTGIIIALLFFITAYPMILVISSSFSDRYAVLAGKVILWPVNFSLEGYRAVFNYPDILTGYRNTLLYTITGTF